ncbi:MAG: hypothetical protein K2N48_01995 [Muribaculaceae bacterium]|nr:hypothetical protein [Muribaculaceae bacterium]
MNKNTQTGLIVTLISTSAVACGALLCVFLHILSEFFSCDYSSETYFLAYISGSIGFLLTAPANIILQIMKKYPCNKGREISVWFITTLAIFLVACAVGVILMLAFKWIVGVSTPTTMAIQFISGAFLLFVSGGINWLLTRNKHN